MRCCVFVLFVVNEEKVLLVVECCLRLLRRVLLVFAGVVKILADLLGGC